MPSVPVFGVLMGPLNHFLISLDPGSSSHLLKRLEKGDRRGNLS